MQVIELNRQTTCDGEVVTHFEAGKRSIQLIGTFAQWATLDDLLYSIVSRKIAERTRQKRDNIVSTGGYGKL